MAPSQFHRPETALTKAKELIKCDKKANALEILYDVMRLRRAKQWQKVLEDLMMLFVDLCVELRKNVHFRKAIYQYKNISAMENTASLEAVLRYYLNSIKAKTEEAQKESKSVLMDVEDLDVLETPESLMLNAVSFEGSQDRSARTILMPWLKFLWDSYRLVLDLLRSNSKLEHLYHSIANDAYDFCIKYGRRAEFRKLSELLRLHTQKVQNQSQPNAPSAINLNTPETQVLHFQTRLRQLDCAMELEMYNEAYKTIEDIWAFTVNLKKVTSAVLLTNYYAKSAELFLRCGCYLYHAAALHKLMFLYRDHKKNVTREELSSLGSRVLCATLAIPLPNAKTNSDKFLLSGEYTLAKQKTLAGLLNLFQVPTRQNLIHDLVRHKVPSLVPQELADLYHQLEADFQPMTLWERAQPALRLMETSPDLNVYTSQLHEVLLSKTVLQLSQVYQTIRLNELVKLCPFMDPIALERSVIELIHNLELPIRINHRLQALVFDEFTDLGISQCDYGGQLVSQSTHVNAPDRLSRQLTMFAQVMQQITEMLEDNQNLPDYRRALVNEYQACRNQLHMELLNRRTYIEARKEQVELIQEERDQIFMEEEARRQAEQDRKLQNEERNLQKEAEERERRKTEDEQARIKRRIALGNYNLLMEHKIGVKLDSKDLTEEQLDQFDADKILEKKALEVKKKRKELAEKAKAMAKKLDYYTRAVRLEELPLLRAAIEPEAEKAREEHERSMREIEEHSRAEHERQLAEKNRLIRMKSDVQRIISQLKEARDQRFKTRLAEWEELCDTTRTQRLAELKAKREAEAAAEAERKAREEEAARREAELAAEAERNKQAQKAKEAEERAAAREEEERLRTANRKGAPEEPYVPSRPADTGPRYSRPPGATFTRNEPLRPSAPADTSGWSRGTVIQSTTVDASPKRPAVDFGSRSDRAPPSGLRNARRTMPSEFDSVMHEDDSGGGWTQVGQHKDSERPHGRPYAPPSFGRGTRNSALPGNMRSGPGRRDERRGNFGFSNESSDWSRGNIVGSNKGSGGQGWHGTNAPQRN